MSLTALRIPSSFFLAASLMASLSTTSHRASAAGDKLVCARAGEAAQELRASGKLVEARAQLLACARDACPAVVRSDCAKWIGEVDASTPSVVVHARDPEGRDLRDVRVTIDGVVVATLLDGQPVSVNPGEHVVRYEHPGARAVEERLLLATGEKNRLLSVTLGQQAIAATKTTTGPSNKGAGKTSNGTANRETSSNGEPIEPHESAGPPASAWIFAAVSAVAVGGFAYFGATGKADLDNLRSTCNGHCPQGDVDRAWDRLIVADVSLGIGILAAGIATWLFVAPRKNDTSAAHLEVAPQAHGATFRVVARF